MRLGRKLVLCASIALALLAGRTAAADDLEKVLDRLNAAAKNFRSTTADFQFDSIQTDPVFDDTVQKGTVYYERTGSGFQMAAHVNEVFSKDEQGKEGKKRPVSQVYGYFGGKFQLFDKNTDQLTISKKFDKYQGYLELGFGASGADLAKKWDIKYLGSEMLDGVKTEKLELIAKDPDVRKNLTRAVIWIDPDRAVSLKQILYFGSSEYRVAVYFNIGINHLPAGAFSLATDSKTQVNNQ